MMSIIKYSLFILFMNVVCNGEDVETAIANKPSFLMDYKRIMIDTSNFKEFVRNSSTFVDKSMLLKMLLNDTNDRILIINYPQNFGKTLNMQMMKNFLEIEVDKKGDPAPREHTLTYRFFKNGEIVLEDRTVQKLMKPLLISKYDDVFDEYAGKWPVIFLNLTALVPGVSFDDLYKEIVNRISDAFAEHEYMKEVFNEIIDNKDTPESDKKQAEVDLQTFERILWKKGNTTEVQSSLSFLADVLAKHFDKKVIILVDSYDAPFHNMYLGGTFPKSHEQIFFDFYRKFNFHTFVVNPSMERAILTGVLPLAKGDLLYSLKDAREYTLLRHADVHKLYGFTKEESEELFKLFDLDANTTKSAHKYYDGYSVWLSNNKTRLYQPFSVAYLVNYRNIKRHSNQFCSKFYAVDSIRQALNALLSGLQLPTNFKNITFYKDDFKRLQDGLYYNEKTDGPILRSFLKYAFASGFLTSSDFEFEGKVCVRFANGEVYSTWGEGLAIYYARKFGFTDMKIGKEECRRFNDDFMEFVASDNRTSVTLKSTLEAYFALVFRPKGFLANENEDMTRLVMDFFALFLKTMRRYPTYDSQILLFSKEVGVVIDSTFNRSSANESLEAAKRSLSKFAPLRIARTRFIGINAKPNASIDLLGETVITKMPNMDYRDV